MADGSISIVVDMDDRQAQADLNRLKRDIAALNKDIDTASRKRDYAAEKAQKARDMAASWKEGESPFSKGEWERMYGAEAAKYQAQVDDLNNEIQGMTAKLEEAESAAGALAERLASPVIPVEQTEQAVEQADKQIEEVNRDLGTTQERVEKITTATKQSTGHMSKLGKSASGLGRKLLGMVKAVFIFQAISSALRGVKNWLMGVIQADSELSASLAQLRGALRTAAQPILNILIPALRVLIGWLAKAAAAIASLISSFFGTTIEQSAAAAQALENQEDAYAGVGGAAKDASKQLAGFDEINKLTAESGGGGGGGARATSYDFGDYGGMLGKISGWLEKYHIDDAIENVRTAFNNLVAAWDTFKNSPTGKWLMGVLRDILGDGIHMGLTLIADSLQIIADILNGDFKAALEDLGKLGIDSWLETVKLIADILGRDDIKEAVEEYSEAIEEAGLTGAGEYMHGKYVQQRQDNVVESIKRGLHGQGTTDTGTGSSVVQQAMDEYLAKLENGEVEDKWIESAGRKIAEFYTSLTDSPEFQALKQAWEDIWTGQALDDWLNATSEKIYTKWSEIKTWWGDTKFRIESAFFVLGAWWRREVKPKIEAIFQPFKDAWEAIQTFYEENIKKPVEEAGQAIGEAFSNALEKGLEGIKGIINGILAAVETALNWIVNKVNSISIDIPNKGIFGDLAGQHIGFNLQPISIPRLAQGAVIPPNKEFLAVLGDQKNGTNVEAPLETIVAAVRQAMGGINRPIVLTIDRREFGRAVVDVYGQENKRVGLKLGGAYA